MPDLNHLKNLLGDEALVARFIALFRQQMPVQLEDLQRYVQEKNWDNAGAEAHAIKGHLLYLNEEAAAGLAYQLETLAENGGGEEAEGLAFALKNAVEVVLTGLSTG